MVLKDQWIQSRHESRGFLDAGLTSKKTAMKHFVDSSEPYYHPNSSHKAVDYLPSCDDMNLWHDVEKIGRS